MGCSDNTESKSDEAEQSAAGQTEVKVQQGKQTNAANGWIEVKNDK